MCSQPHAMTLRDHINFLSDVFANISLHLEIMKSGIARVMIFGWILCDFLAFFSPGCQGLNLCLARAKNPVWHRVTLEGPASWHFISVPHWDSEIDQSHQPSTLCVHAHMQPSGVKSVCTCTYADFSSYTSFTCFQKYLRKKILCLNYLSIKLLYAIKLCITTYYHEK